MPEGKPTEEKVTEEKTGVAKILDNWIYQVDSGKLVTLHGLLAECVKLARETVEGEFLKDPILNVDNIAEMTCNLAIALFHRASVPDQTQTMLAALETGLEWYSAREKEQKANSAKIDESFKMSMQDIVPPRRMAPIERLVRNLLDFATSYTEEELRKLSDQVEEAKKTFTVGDVPTPKE